MSRKGKTPIALPSGVETTVAQNKLTVKGKIGTLTIELMNGISVSKKDSTLMVEKQDFVKDSFWGLYRALVNNVVVGVSEGFEKRLSMIGVGFRAAVKGKEIELQIGFSFPISVEIPQGITVKVEKSTEIIISGIDKQLVGQFAATIRSKRPPEPYKGKGIRYKGEYVRKKAGKAAAKGPAA